MSLLKDAKLTFIVASIILIPEVTLGQALDCSAVTAKCKKTGIEKINEVAGQSGCTLESSTVRVTGTDCRSYNPSKFVWFAGTVNCPSGNGKNLQQMVQYDSLSGRCL